MSKPFDYTYDYNLAKMAGASYFSPEEIEASMRNANEDDRYLPDNWRVLHDDFVDTNAKTGFVAYAFKNDKTGEIVIAYRGSEPTGPNSHGLIDYRGANAAIAKDGDAGLLVRGLPLGRHPRAQLEGLMRAALPDWHAQFEQGLDFAQEIIQKYGHEYKIHVTGHSLGGAIAQVASDMHHLPGRTFDPGGAANLAQSDAFAAWAQRANWQRPLEAHARGDTYPRGVDHDFVNYLVNDSLVSRHSGPHLGETENVTGLGGREPGQRASYFLKQIVPGPLGTGWGAKDLIEQHDMDRILRVFKDARDTGLLNRVGVVTPEHDSPTRHATGPAMKPPSASDSLDDVITRMADAARNKDSAAFGAAVTAYAQSPMGQAFQHETQERFQQIKAQEQQAAWERQQQQQAQQQEQQMQAQERRGPVMRM